jgi:hypothetical protein
MIRNQQFDLKYSSEESYDDLAKEVQARMSQIDYSLMKSEEMILARNDLNVLIRQLERLEMGIGALSRVLEDFCDRMTCNGTYPRYKTDGWSNLT